MKVIKHQQRLSEARATAVFVAFDDAETLSHSMLAGVTSPFPVVVDADRTSYREWGLQRATFAGVWLDPSVWGQYWRLLRSGERIRTLGTDTRQLGGDFIVNPHGLITYARPQHRDDRPPVGQLLNALANERPSA